MMLGIQRNNMNNLISGARYFMDGFSLITKPGMKRFIVIPVAINVIVFIGLFFALRHYMVEFSGWLQSYLPTWLHWLAIILWILFLISFFLIVIFTFVTLANIISAPFNSFLAEKVELLLTGKIPEERSLWENIKDIPRIIGRQLSILGYYLPRAILILILFFIPIIHSFVPFIWFLFHAWMMTLTYIDYPTDNHRVPIRDVRIYLNEKRWVTLGFGMSVLIATMIPILNFFTIPVAVASATKFWLLEESHNSVSR